MLKKILFSISFLSVLGISSFGNIFASTSQELNLLQDEKVSLDLVHSDTWSQITPLDYQYVTADSLGVDGYPTTDTQVFRLLVKDTVNPDNINMEVVTGIEAQAVTGTDDGESSIPGLKYIKFNTSDVPFSDGYPIYFNVSDHPGGSGKTFATTVVNPQSILEDVTLDLINRDVWNNIADIINQQIVADGLNTEGYLTTNTKVIKLLAKNTVNPDNINMEVVTGAESQAVTGTDDGESPIPGFKYIKFNTSDVPFKTGNKVYFNISDHPGGPGEVFAGTTIH